MKKIKHIIRQSISAILISTMVLTTVGCGNSTEKETELQTEAQTVLKEKIKVTITDDNGNKITLEGETKVDDNGKTVIEATDSAGNKITLDADISIDSDGKVVVDNVQIKDKENVTLITDDNKPAEITKPVETQTVTQPVTQSTTAATQPVTVKPTEPVTQAPTTKPTQPATQPTTAATQPATQAPTSDIHQYNPSIINTPEGQQALRNVVIKWVNIFREEEQPGCPKLTQNYDLNKVYQDRAVSVSKNYQHNNDEEIALCNKYKAGVLVPYVQGLNEKYCELYGNPYYGTHLIEAIGHVGGTLSYSGKDLEDAFDNLGKRIVTQFRNSPAHWDYVGMKVDAEISVGVYAAGAMCNQIYTTVAVGKDERP